MFQKLCDFIIHVPAGSSNWPSHLHEPLWIGISIPFIPHSPWCIQGTPLLVEMERKLRTVFSTGTGDGRHLVRQLLRASRRLCTVSKLWHKECYTCLGQGLFPMAKVADADGNVWFKQAEREKRLNHGVRGAHAAISFQCEDCWILNIEGRLRIAGLDDTYVMCIRRANLDAMAGRAETTIQAHAASVMRTVRNCEMIGKTPSIPPRGPMPLSDPVGMGVAVEMLHLSLVAKGRITEHIQYDSMRKPRATFSQLWDSSPQGIAEGSSFGSGIVKSTLTNCPTQSRWFSTCQLGAETRMGFQSQANKPLPIKVTLKILKMIKADIPTQPDHVSYELVKVGAAIAVGLCASLRGPEIFMMDLAGVRDLIHRGREGVMPADPLLVISPMPHIYILPLWVNLRVSTE